MDKLTNDFSLGLFIWQAILFILLILGVFIGYKLVRYFNLKNKNKT